MVDIRRVRPGEEGLARQLITGILHQELGLDAKVYPDSDLASLAQTYGGRRETFLVALAGESVVGTVAIKEDSEAQALLRRLFVRRDHRHQGLGSRLVDEAIAFCQRQGYHQVVFRSTDRMGTANRLLKKKGFVEQQRLPLGEVEIILFTRHC